MPGRRPRCAAAAAGAAVASVLENGSGVWQTRVLNPAICPCLPQTDLQAAELAKRGLEAERQELHALREELRQQQAQASAEALRLAELQQVGAGRVLWTLGLRCCTHICRYAATKGAEAAAQFACLLLFPPSALQREAHLKQREGEAIATEQRLAAAQQELAEAERRVRSGADAVADSIVSEARGEADAILAAARDECRRAEAELKALREQLQAAEGQLKRREVAAEQQASEVRSASEAAAAEQRRAAEASGLQAEKEQLLRTRCGAACICCMSGSGVLARFGCGSCPTGCSARASHLPAAPATAVQGGAASRQGAGAGAAGGGAGWCRAAGGAAHPPPGGRSQAVCHPISGRGFSRQRQPAAREL